MPKSENQKLKLLYLQKILLEKTDEEHTITVPKMIAELARHGISAERKSIYADLEALEYFGLDLVCRKTKTYDYYVANKPFELPELKLLADAVASSRFITEKKSNELIQKIERLASVHQAKQLQRQIFVAGRVKTMNERIYYNVDAIHQAIAQNRQISFRYFDYSVTKEKQFHSGGETYVVSPYALAWSDDNYYVITHSAKRSGFTHFRVDKMENVESTDKKRFEITNEKVFNLSAYLKKTFGMFGGKEERIKLQFDNSLIGVVIDRFGQDVPVTLVDADHFVITVDAFVSPTLMGWLFNFGSKVKILSPQSLIDQFRQQSEESLEQYRSAKN